MEKELIKRLLIEQGAVAELSNAVPREVLQSISGFQKTKLIVVVSGVRRCGKSTLLQMLRTKNSYYVNFDDERFVDFTVNDFQAMHELLIELYGSRQIFFFDEIQNIKSWERFARRLHDDGKKIYITGSNASMLSRELGTHLTGRHIPITLFPFSFREFLIFKGHAIELQKLTTLQKSIAKKLFNEYVTKGGFPEYLQNEKEEYLKSMYENIIYRDIITRYGITGEKALKETVYYTASNIGKEISFNSIRKLANLTSATTVRQYFEYLENSYLIFLVPRYSSSLKKQIYFNKKAYLIDTALARIIGFRESKDAGRMLENIVFLQLKRQGKEIYFHKEKYECDFIIRNGAQITEAIQVTCSLKDKNREINGLMEAMKKYKLKKGLILTDDAEEELIVEARTISIKPVWKWLLE